PSRLRRARYRTRRPRPRRSRRAARMVRTERREQACAPPAAPGVRAPWPRTYDGRSQRRLKAPGPALKALLRLDEPVAGAGLRHEVAGGDLLAQMRDVDVEVVRLHLVRRPPHLAQEHPVGQELPAVLREDAQKVELVRAELDAL